MTMMMIGLVVLALVLLFAAPALARLVIRDRDPVALTRMIQVVAIILLVVALLVSPRSPESTAFPPPPEGPAGID
jgi:amino acid transporter